MSEWLLFNANSTILQLFHGRQQINYQWDDDEARFVLDQHTEFDCYSASLLTRQSRVDMSLHSTYYADSEATHTNVIVFGLTLPVLEPTIYHTRGEPANYYTADVTHDLPHSRRAPLTITPPMSPTIYHTRGEPR